MSGTEIKKATKTAFKRGLSIHSKELVASQGSVWKIEYILTEIEVKEELIIQEMTNTNSYSKATGVNEQKVSLYKPQGKKENGANCISLRSTKTQNAQHKGKKG